ncbi:MAG: glycosyltransferase family 2 protein [Xanthomonadales bacterium]|nr:glycosyltransferase family 2 protein [Xanthomonadales bacterium]
MCKNAATTLGRTLESLDRQRDACFESIIVDGLSTDSTPALINRYASLLSRVISEPDDGIADAMNKGIHAASGKYLLFLNADDYLWDADVLCSMQRYLDGSEIVAGSVWYGPKESGKLMRSRGFGPWTRYKIPFHHQGAFIRKSLFDRIGLYDTGYRIDMDYDFFLRAYHAGATARVIPEITVSVMGDQGISSLQIMDRIYEEKRVHERNATGPVDRFLHGLWWAFYPHYKHAAVWLERRKKLRT